MVNIDEARFEQLIVAEAKMEVIYNIFANSKYGVREDVCKAMGWDHLLEEEPVFKPVNIPVSEVTEDDVNIVQGV